MNVIKFLLKFKLLTITLLSISSICMSSISYAHSSQAEYQSRIKVIPITRIQNKLLPKILYVQTMSHTFKRKFAFQNRVIKQVYYDASQPTNKLYAKLSSKRFSNTNASSYWP